MIIPVLSTRWAQWSYDSAKDSGDAGNLLHPMHFTAQLSNVVTHTAGPLYMTSMSNPSIYSYAYAGVNAERYGIAANVADRKAFQMASSPAYRAGEKFGKRIGLKGGARTAGRIATRAIPGLGWAMLAYDAYDLIANQRLFGVQL